MPANEGESAAARHAIWITILAIAALTFIAQRIGDQLVSLSGGTPISALWPPNGIAIAFFIAAPVSRWPWLALGFAATKLTMEPTLGVGSVQTLTDVFEILCVAAIVRWRRPRFTLDSANSLLLLYGAIAVGVLLSSQVAAMAALIRSPRADYWVVVQTWAFSDALGSMLFTPASLLAYDCITRKRQTPSWREAFEVALMVGVIAVVIVYFPRPAAGHRDFFIELPYVLFPLLGAVAFRTSRAATFGILTLTVLALTAQTTVFHTGPFFHVSSPEDEIIAALQTFLGALILSISLLTFLLHERTRQQRLLADHAWHYELLIEGQSDFIVRVNEHGIVQFVNASFGRYFGVAPLDAIGTSWGDYVTPTALARCFRDIRRITIAAPEFHVSYQMLRSGTPVWHEWHGRGQFDESGSLLEFVAAGSDITERVRAEQALRASDEKFHTAFESSPSAIDIVRTRDGMILDVNRAWEELFEYPRAEAIGKSSLELGLWVDLADRTELIRQGSKTGYAVLHQSLQRTKSGHTKLCLLASRTLRLNREMHMLTNHLDISSRVAMEQALRISEERFSKAFRSSPTAMTITRARDGVIVDVNDALCQAIGYTREQLVGHSAADLNIWGNPHDRQRYAAELKTHGRVSMGELQFRRSDGELIIGVTSAEFFLMDGVTHIVTNMLDVTKRVEAERALQVSQEKLASIFDASPAAITLHDIATGQLIEFNNAVVNLTGYSREDLLRKRVQDFTEWPDRGELVRFNTSLRTQGTVQNIEARLAASDGRRVEVIGSAEVLMIDGRRHVLTAFIDITERNVLFAQLQQSQKMEAMGRLVSGISHDFNNIITAVRGYAEMLIEFSGLTNKNLEYATEIERASLRASDLISQLMMFARKEDEKASIVDAVTVISEIQGMLETAMESNVRLHFVLPITALPVRIGRSGLEQVVLNLVINAGDAIVEKGDVTIEVDAFDNDTQVRLRVSDNGVGISATNRDKIFEPFFTTKTIGQGTGLGLPIVYGIVERAGGHVTVNSEVGKGTCFTVCFPRAMEAPMLIAADTRRAQRVASSNLRIIVAEDDDGVRQFTVNTLEHAGHHVSPARNGADVLAILEQTSEFDLVLSDIDMPSIGGLQLKAVMSVRFSQIPILLMTGKLDGLGHEGKNILHKPFSAAALCEFVEQAHSSSDVGTGIPGN